MNVFAVYEKDVIINCVVAETKEDVEIATNMQAIESVDGKPGIGWEYTEEHGWRPPKPYPSWVWENNQWTAPTPITGSLNLMWEWDEDNLEWVGSPYPQPFPSWTLDDDFIWQPPVPYPNDKNDHVWDEDSLSWVLPE